MNLSGNKKLLIGIVVVIVLASIAVVISQENNTNSPSPTPFFNTNSTTANETEKTRPDIEVIAENLEIPWEIAYLPDGDYLVTERPGRLIRIGSNNQTFEISGVRHIGEGGLLGLTLDPMFLSNNYIYLYLTSDDSGEITNRVERYTYSDDNLTERIVILESIEGASNHDGGRIAFGPDGYLYITTGDAGNTQLAQDENSLNGKILRINKDGSPAADNPFNNEVYSLGHRNVQGLSWDKSGNLWATEHGRSGIRSGLDELNLIRIGSNYGWPIIQGDEIQDGLVSPVMHSGGNTWAPSGSVYLGGSVYFAGLRGKTLYQAVLNGTNIDELKTHLVEEYGRLRTVSAGPDGYLYILTSNRDGRGSVSPGDDKIIRVNPEILE